MSFTKLWSQSIKEIENYDESGNYIGQEVDNHGGNAPDSTLPAHCNSLVENSNDEVILSLLGYDLLARQPQKRSKLDTDPAIGDPR